jgi:hypothetical protein
MSFARLFTRESGSPRALANGRALVLQAARRAKGAMALRIPLQPSGVDLQNAAESLWIRCTRTGRRDVVRSSARVRWACGSRLQKLIGRPPAARRAEARATAAAGCREWELVAGGRLCGGDDQRAAPGLFG